VLCPLVGLINSRSIYLAIYLASLSGWLKLIAGAGFNTSRILITLKMLNSAEGATELKKAIEIESLTAELRGVKGHKKAQQLCWAQLV
jgi:hypothetical protein